MDAMRSKVMVGVLLTVACSTSNEKVPGVVDAPGSGSAATDAGVDGSSSPGGSLAPNQSGSRLKMKVITSSDGAKSFNGWHDTQRDEDCTFRLAEDGVMRCMPAAIGILYPDPHTPNGYYADSTCQTPAVLYYTCAAPKYLTYSVSASTCVVNPANGGRVVLAGATMATAYQWGSNCQQVTPPAGMAFYPMGATVAPSSFVDGSESLE
jgi:hypothetical protein